MNPDEPGCPSVCVSVAGYQDMPGAALHAWLRPANSSEQQRDGRQVLNILYGCMQGGEASWEPGGMMQVLHQACPGCTTQYGVSCCLPLWLQGGSVARRPGSGCEAAGGRRGCCGDHPGGAGDSRGPADLGARCSVVTGGPRTFLRLCCQLSLLAYLKHIRWGPWPSPYIPCCWSPTNHCRLPGTGS